jgi:hypothetical protein
LPVRKEIIEKYHHLISSRYKWYGWIAGLVWLSGVFLNAWFDPVPWHSYVTSGMIGLGLGFLWYIFNHRYQMLFHFNPLFEDSFERLEKYLGDKKQRWDNTQLVRFGLMAILVIAMIILLFFAKENKWTGITASVFVILILAFILKGWLDFNDEILLQDIRHDLQDQASE